MATAELTQRVRVEYTNKEMLDIRDDRKIILTEIKKNHRNDISKIHPNQKECAKEIVTHFRDRKIINVMVLALTQSGKTGTMIGLIRKYLKRTSNIIPVENIYIITGLSSCEWIQQTRARVPKSIQDRVFHRDNLTRDFVKDIMGKKNVLVIIDEIQIAAKEKQTVFKSFQTAGFYNKQYLMENDIKIVEFTATPDGTIYDQMKWGEHSKKVMMTPGCGYTSCFDLMEQGRVFQYKDLCGVTKGASLDATDDVVRRNILEIQDHFDEYKKPKYHIIRTPKSRKGDMVIENFHSVLGDRFVYKKYDGESDIDDINDLLRKKPSVDTFIFIKEMLRCAKTLYKKYLGVVYERYTTQPDDAAIIQGLIGRGTGYDDNGRTIYFTNIKSIEKYQHLWDSKFEDKTVRWKSKTTKYTGDTLRSNKTRLNPTLVDGMISSSSGDDDDSVDEYVDEPELEHQFRTYAEAKAYWKDRFGGRGPNEPKVQPDGFIRNHIRGVTEVMSKEEVEANSRWGIKKRPRLHVCYDDPTDPSTVLYWVIHY